MKHTGENITRIILYSISCTFTFKQVQELLQIFMCVTFIIIIIIIQQI